MALRQNLVQALLLAHTQQSLAGDVVIGIERQHAFQQAGSTRPVLALHAHLGLGQPGPRRHSLTRQKSGFVFQLVWLALRQRFQSQQARGGLALFHEAAALLGPRR